jgi:hypothetical protein
VERAEAEGMYSGRLNSDHSNQGYIMASENLEEFLTGNKVQNSPYAINMLREVYCQKLFCRLAGSGWSSGLNLCENKEKRVSVT